MTTYTNFMVDFETLGVRQQPCPGSFAIVAFNPAQNYREIVDLTILPNYTAYLNLSEGIAAGLHIDHETVRWWMEQKNRDALIAPVNGRAPLCYLDFCYLIQDFIEVWCKQKEDRKIWCRGLDFDFALIKRIFQHTNQTEPWPYYAGRDVRTFCSTILDSGQQRILQKQLQLRFEAHNPVTDCMAQIAMVQIVQEKLTNMASALSQLNAKEEVS